MRRLKYPVEVNRSKLQAQRIKLLGVTAVFCPRLIIRKCGRATMHLQLRYWAFKFDLSLCCTWLVFNQIADVGPDFWTARPSAVPTLGRHPDKFVTGTAI